LNGPAVENKGHGAVPRKIKGHYVMLGRQDAENIYVMFSDHLHFWHSMQLGPGAIVPMGIHSIGQLRVPYRNRTPAGS
jgi:hypothetical protein